MNPGPRAVAVLALSTPLVAQAPGAVDPESAAPAPPRLVVLCAVDQLATWVLDAALPHCSDDGGFRQLRARGAAFPACAFQHACSETGPGHATIGTGAPARVHGIVKNEWYDRDRAGVVYCASEAGVAPLAQFPEGKARGPGRLLVPTIGDLLKQRGEDHRVVAVAHKDRSAILMGGASADAVVWCEVATGAFVTNTRWGPVAPPWLLELAEQRPADRQFGWTWERGFPEAAYADCIDDRPFEFAHTSSGARTLPVTIRGKRDEPGAAFWLESFLSPIANEVVLDVALAALRGAELGRDDAVDLLCVSFPACDTVGHYFGPDSVEARDTLLRFDALLGRFLAVLDAEVGRDRYAFVLTADHGVGLPPEVAKAKGLGGGRGLLHTRARAAAEKALREHFGVDAAAPAQGPFVAHAGEYSLVLDRARIARQVGDAELVPAFAAACTVAAAAVEKVPGILRGFATAEVLQNGAGDDPIRQAIWYAIHPERSGDVLFAVQPYWLEAGLAASHGTPHDYDRAVPLFACGPGIAAGHSSMAPVSPGLATVFAAHWLGIAAPAAAVDRLPADAFVRATAERGARGGG